MSENSVVKNIDVNHEIENSLFQYVSHNVSCRPYSEYRHNIKLKPVFSTIKANVVTIRGVTISLPTSGRWYLYYIDNSILMDVKLPDRGEWVCLADRFIKRKISIGRTERIRSVGFCSQHKMDIRVVVGSTSLCIPRRYVFVMKNPTEDCFLIAIDQTAMRKLSLSNREVPDDIWTSFYYHHKDANFSLTNYQTDLSEDRSLFIAAANRSDSVAFLNGEIVTKPLTESDVEEGSYAEVLIDDSIVGYIDVDLSQGYDYKNKQNDLRFLIHIPKALNRNNYLINHRVCDFVMIPEFSLTGRFIHRANTDDKFITLTHNDFGIDKSLISKYQELLGENCKLRVYIRNHKKIGLILDRDSKYIACLYRLSDSLIKDHLLGKTSMTMWSAKELEQYSPYSDLVDQYTARTHEQNLLTWINCLGYPTAIDVSCKRVFHMLATPDLLHNFYVSLPAYYLGKKVTAHVYLDGKLIDPDHIRFEQELQHLKIMIDPSCKFSNDFTNNKPVSYYEYFVHVRESGKLSYFTIEIFENPDYRAGMKKLETGDSATFYVDQDYVIYRSVDLDDNNKLPDHYIYKRFKFNTSYRPLYKEEMTSMVQEEILENSKVRKVTIINNDSTGIFIIASKHAYAKIYGVELQLKEMNYDIFCSHKLMVRAKPWLDYDEVTGMFISKTNTVLVPYLNTDNEILVYLNRRELIQNLDFRIYQAKTNTNAICGQFVVMQNVDYLNPAGNTFEVYSIAEKNALSISGFLTDGRSTFESYYSLFPNSSVLITDGFVYNHAPSTVIGEYSSNLHHWCNICNQCNLYNETRRGAATKIRAMMPYQFDDIIDRRKLDTDIRNMKIVTDYMESVEYDLEAPAIIERSHHIYSTFIQTIVELVCRNKLVYNLDWTDQEIKDALSPYESMIKYDIGLSSENVEVTDPNLFIQPPISGIDYRFVDVLPTYRIEPLIEDLSIIEEYPLLVIRGSHSETVNGNYICDNPGPTDPINYGMNERTHKIWKNEKGSYIIHKVIYGMGGYWLLYDENRITQYRAQDFVGVKKIWELNWEVLNENTPITITPVWIEVNTANEFLARRISYTLHTPF